MTEENKAVLEMPSFRRAKSLALSLPSGATIVIESFEEMSVNQVAETLDEAKRTVIRMMSA